MMTPNINITSAKGDFLIDQSGDYYFDLCMGYGSVSLGHHYQPIINEQIRQIQNYSSPGFLNSQIFEQAKYAVEECFHNSYLLHGFYSSGANAVEIALKMAMMCSKKSKIISFAKSMHGKTLFAGKLGFESCLIDDNQIIKIPFVGDELEDRILQLCEQHMRLGDVAGVIIEPIQMSAGGFTASNEFYKELQNLALKYGVLQIYDEILIGFYRTGTLFFFEEHNIQPDIVITGKAMASGFPISAVCYHPQLNIPTLFRGGGTYFNHPLACASVIATIAAFKELNVVNRIELIEKSVKKYIPSPYLSGSGALWNINLGSVKHAHQVVAALLKEKIIVSFYDQYIRFFPNYLVDRDKLEVACAIVSKFL